MTLSAARAAEIAREQKGLNEDAIRQHAREAPIIEPLTRAIGYGGGIAAHGSDGSANADAQPVPLTRLPEPGAAYPIAALGPILGAAAEALTEHVQVPAALAGNSVLAAAALGAQGLSNVQTLGGARPLSLYVLTIAASGERKSATDELALRAVRSRERALHTSHEQAQREYEADLEAYKLRKRQVRDSVEDAEGLKRALLAVRAPVFPRKPSFLCADPTAEGLVLSFRDGQLSQALFSDEGGAFIGSYAMSEESELRTIAMLSKVWDGGALNRVRAKDAENITLHGRRLSLHLMAQPAVAEKLLGNPLYRLQGFLARVLIAEPVSLVGMRLHDGRVTDPRTDERMIHFEQTLARLLARTGPEDRELGGLDLPCLTLTPEAREVLISAYNEIEQAQGRDGELATMREFASKSAEHACRIAGVLTLVNDPDAVAVSGEDMCRALELVQFYLHEYRRLVGNAGVSAEIRAAATLLDWIDRKGIVRITARDVMRKGPNCIREAPVAKGALQTLADNHWLMREGSEYVLAGRAQLALREG